MSSAADAGDEYEEEAAPVVSANTGAPITAWDDDFAADAGDADMGVANDDYDAGDDMGWGDDEGLDDLGDFGEETKAAPVDEMAGLNEISDESGFQMPPAGRPPAGCWVANSSHAADHMAAGGASSAMQLLHRQIAASDFSVLKGPMIGCYLGSSVSLPGKTAKLTSAVIILSLSDQFSIFQPFFIIFHAGIPGSGSIVLPLMRNDAIGHPGNDSLPRIPVNMKTLVAGVRQGYRLFQTGKFNDAKNAFSEVLAQIPLTVTDNRNDVNEIKKMLEICREYITAIRIKGAMTAAGDDPVRSTELSAYFTHCDLQPMHLLLALRSAMGTAFKHKNFIVAASMARRLLELPDMKSERNADLRMKVGSFISIYFPRLVVHQP